MASTGGILSSTGFKIDGNNNECFFDDDGAGNVRLYYMSSGVKSYLNSTQGTIDYKTGAFEPYKLSFNSYRDLVDKKKKEAFQLLCLQ